jgi:hypothetical protein
VACTSNAVFNAVAFLATTSMREALCHSAPP